MKPSSSKLTQSQVKMYSFVDSAISDMDGENAIVKLCKFHKLMRYAETYQNAPMILKQMLAVVPALILLPVYTTSV